jgi:hypothetical protein
MCRIRRSIVQLGAVAVLLLPAATTAQTRPSSDFQKAVEEAVKARRAGQSAEEATLVIQKLVRIDENDMLSAIREAGYRAEEAVGAASRALGLTPTRGSAAMLSSGYASNDVARVYQGLVKGTSEIANGFMQAGRTAGETIATLESVGYARDLTLKAVDGAYTLGANALAAQLKAAGQGAVVIGESLRLAGYSTAQIGAALRAAGYDAIEIAASLKGIGLDLAETAAELRTLGYDMNTMATALVQAHGPLGVPLAIALKGAGGTAAQVAAALDHAGLSLQQSAAGLRAAGYGTAAIGSALIGLGNTLAEVGSAMKAAGFAALEVAQAFAENNVSAKDGAEVLLAIGYANADVANALRDAWSQSAAQAVATMQDIGFEATESFVALMESYQLSAQQTFNAIAEEYGLTAALAAARSAGIALNQAAQWAKAVTSNAGTLALALKDAYAADASRVAEALSKAGFAVNDVAAAIATEFSLTALAFAKAMAPIVTSPQQLAQLLVDHMSMTLVQAGEILAQIQF